jgi:RimJ/RimL family protein N-acetyltransferase
VSEVVLGLLEGKKVNLRVMEKEDIPLFSEWCNNLEFFGEFEWLPQRSRAEHEKRYDAFTSDTNTKRFIIEKKDGTKIGNVVHFLTGSLLEIGYELVPNERGKGYCTEAVKIIVDYLFLSKDLPRIQAQTDPRNVASQKVLEKAGFTKEGTLRKSYLVRGEWTDSLIYSILREEWKEPKILTKTV